jgi:hypothetical protein
MRGGKRADVGAFQGESAGLMWGGSGACSHGMSSTPSTLDELSVSSGG